MFDKTKSYKNLSHFLQEYQGITYQGQYIYGLHKISPFL